ncbi:vitamin B12 ABC transporter permease BtuC, partial [Aeromonas hydrophila]
MPAPDHLGGQPPLLAARALAVANRLAPLSALRAGELPIGVITASVGAPLFIYLLLRQDAHA